MRLFTACVLVLSGCRFGGENGDALALVEPRRDAGLDAEATDGAGEFDGEGDGDGADDDAEDDASVGAAPDGATSDGGDDASAAEECLAVVLPGCDPVRNTGCTDGLTQCVIDPESSMPAGRCVFTGVPTTPCSESTLSTTCLPQYACVQGECRRYCSCDSDCAADETCGSPQDQRGTVRVCAATQP